MAHATRSVQDAPALHTQPASHGTSPLTSPHASVRAVRAHLRNMAPQRREQRCGFDGPHKGARVDEARVDEARVDEARVDEAGVDEAGVDEAGVDEAGWPAQRHPRVPPPPYLPSAQLQLILGPHLVSGR